MNLRYRSLKNYLIIIGEYYIRFDICFHISLPLIQEGQLSVSGERMCTG